MSYANSGPPRGEGCGPRGSANRILLTHVNFATRRVAQPTAVGELRAAGRDPSIDAFV